MGPNLANRELIYNAGALMTSRYAVSKTVAYTVGIGATCNVGTARNQDFFRLRITCLRLGIAKMGIYNNTPKELDDRSYHVRKLDRTEYAMYLVVSMLQYLTFFHVFY